MYSTRSIKENAIKLSYNRKDAELSGELEVTASTLLYLTWKNMQL